MTRLELATGLIDIAPGEHPWLLFPAALAVLVFAGAQIWTGKALGRGDMLRRDTQPLLFWISVAPFLAGGLLMLLVGALWLTGYLLMRAIDA